MYNVRLWWTHTNNGHLGTCLPSSDGGPDGVESKWNCFFRGAGAERASSISPSRWAVEAQVRTAWQITNCSPGLGRLACLVVRPATAASTADDDEMDCFVACNHAVMLCKLRLSYFWGLEGLSRTNVTAPEYAARNALENGRAATGGTAASSAFRSAASKKLFRRDADLALSPPPPP